MTIVGCEHALVLLPFSLNRTQGLVPAIHVLLGSCSSMHVLVYLSHGWLDLHHDKPAERHAVRRRSERSTTPSLSAPRRPHRRIHETIRIENAFATSNRHGRARHGHPR